MLACFVGEGTGLKTGHYNCWQWLSAIHTRIDGSHRIEMPGWRGEELLRLVHDAGLLPPYSDRLFLPACGWRQR